MKKWFVLNTKPKHELKIVNELTKIGILSYCPAIKAVKQYSDRKKKILKPLISSYIFIYIDENRRNDIFGIAGVVRYLFWLGKPAIVRDSEINTMKKYIDGIYSDNLLSSLDKGQFYKISEGPFAGQNGKVIELQKSKIKLKLDSIGMIITLKKAAA